MFCSNCGNQIPDGSKFCPNCGSPIAPAAGASVFEQAKEKVASTAQDVMSEVDNAVDTARQGLNEAGNTIDSAVSEIESEIKGNYSASAPLKTDRSLIAYIILSLITCGIYGIYWEYKLGNRLAKNAQSYGLSFQENGTTIIMWRIFGSLICFVGTFIGSHILIKNVNAICEAYNQAN